jgi:Centriolar protein SAS N-terminal
MADSEGVFDFSPLDELDPSLSDGFHLVYDREVPIEIRQAEGGDNSTQQGQSQQGVIESIKVKVLIVGADDSPSSIRVELSSEADLFFYYNHVIDESSYLSIKATQNLIVDFNNYASILIRMLNSCIREPHVYLAVFSLISEQEGKLDLIQNMEYKYVELLSCSFVRSPIEVVQNQISYRYNSMKQRLSVMQARVHDIVTLVKTKNPSLLLQLQKTSPSAGSGANQSMATSSSRR